MKIAIDKNSLEAIKPGNTYIYLFDNEPLEDLLKLNLHCIYYKYCGFVDINLTNYDIECTKKTTINEMDYDTLPKHKDYKLGIIIPNYNYAECLDKCLNSILNQTYKNFEIIFVDDCSTDNSVEVAKKILNKPHKVIELKQKRYNGGARNEAFLHLSEDVDYVWYIDSDDWLADNYVFEKINDRLQTYPDALFVGLAQYKNGRTLASFIPRYKDKYEAIKGWSGSCAIVTKKSLATRQECLFNEGTLKEDKNHHCKICIYMSSFTTLREPAYVWNRENTKSVTTDRQNIKWKTSTIRHYADCMELAMSVKGQDGRIDNYLAERLRLCEAEVQKGGDNQW